MSIDSLRKDCLFLLDVINEMAGDISNGTTEKFDTLNDVKKYYFERVRNDRK